jgi:hypothetical protein
LAQGKEERKNKRGKVYDKVKNKIYLNERNCNGASRGGRVSVLESTQGWIVGFGVWEEVENRCIEWRGMNVESWGEYGRQKDDVRMASLGGKSQKKRFTRDAEG